MRTCWSSGVQMPQVIWLSRLISEDQCLCPLTEPTSTKPSRYAMRAWVPSCDQVKSLTCRKEMFPHQDRLYIYKDSFQDTGKKKSVYLGSSVVHQLHGPSSFILDPHKYTSFHIAGGELLKGFIPTHQDNLQKCAKTLLLFFFGFFCKHRCLSAQRDIHD